MLRFAANLSFLYTDLPFLERFAAAAADGFTGVEYLFPYEWPPTQLLDLLNQHHLRQVLFNAPPGDWDAGERGIACLPGREEEFREGIRLALSYATGLGCKQVHVMAGIVPSALDRDLAWQTYRDNLAWAAGEAAKVSVDILIEPINTRDMPGYLLNHQEEAHALLSRISKPNLKVQMDLYHAQIMDGDVTVRLQHHLADGGTAIGHMQIASVPGRHEPDEGELSWLHILGVLEELKYDGWIGCEYRPRRGTSEGLDWLRRYRQGDLLSRAP